MNLIEQLNDLCTEYEGGALALSVVTDLRAILEQHKSEAVEPVAVPAGYKLLPIEPTEDMKRAYTDKYGFPSYGAGHEYRFMVKEAPEAPQPDHTKLIGELVRALDRYSGCTGRLSDEINALLTKARESIR